jgi:hypothetical protein
MAAGVNDSDELFVEWEQKGKDMLQKAYSIS